MKLFKPLFFIIISLSFFSCQRNAYVALHDVERGLFLDRAYPVSNNTFFQRRLENDVTNKDEWIIVNQDLEKVYFGKVVRNGNYVMIAPFYKTDKNKLDEIFPGFTSIDGKLIKATVFDNYIKPLIQEKLIPICPQSHSINYSKRKYKLTDNGIESDIKFTGRCYEDNLFTADIHLILDPKDLTKIKEEINIK